MMTYMHFKCVENLHIKMDTALVKVQSSPLPLFRALYKWVLQQRCTWHSKALPKAAESLNHSDEYLITSLQGLLYSTEHYREPSQLAWLLVP
jgi:hypothetical protein